MCSTVEVVVIYKLITSTLREISPEIMEPDGIKIRSTMIYKEHVTYIVNHKIILSHCI